MPAIVLSLLNEPWWSGVAGIAQVSAAVLSLIVVWQTMRMIRAADHQRRESVAPDWGVHREPQWQESNLSGPIPPGTHLYLELMNTGFGPARELEVIFFTLSIHSGYGQELEALYNPDLRQKVIPPDTVVWVRVYGTRLEFLDGLLTVRYKSRLGDTLTSSFRVTCHTSGPACGQYTIRPQ
jgi:hypothetical protein